MNEATKNITKETFPVFKKLIEEVIVKATSKPVETNPYIGEVFSKKESRVIKQIPEAKAREIIVKITNETLEEDNRGRRLQALINAALNNDSTVNARLYTLDLLADYVLKNVDEQAVNNGILNWKTYVYRNKHLLLSCSSVTTTILEESILLPEIDSVLIIDDKTTIKIRHYEHETFQAAEGTPRHLQEENNQNNTSTSDTINAKNFIHAGTWGGIYAGIIVSVIIAILRYVNGNNITPFSTGYENVSFGNFMQNIFTPLLLFHIITGAFLGWLCCYSAAAKNKVFNNIVLFIISFIAFLVLRQAMARDAWYVPGTYLIYDQHHQLLRRGGGYLGEPDFETLATALMNTTVMVTIVNIFRRRKYSVSTIKKTVEILVKTTLYGVLSWCLIYCIYLIFTVRLGLLPKNSYFISSAIFTFDFPHPERVTTVAFFSIVYVFGIVASIQYQAPANKLQLA